MIWYCVVHEHNSLLNGIWSVCGSDNDGGDDGGGDGYGAYVYTVCALSEVVYNTLILRDFAFSSSDVPNNQ